MKNRILTALGVSSILLAAGCATAPDKNQAAMDKPPAAQQETALSPGIAGVEITTMTATVQAVDVENRRVTLRQKGGQPFTIQVSEEVRNLPQVRVGDQVVVRHTEAVAVRINPDTSSGLASRRETLSGDRAAPGQRPAGTVRNTVEIIANIRAIDPNTRKILLQGAERAVTVKAPADVNLSRLYVGDQVLLTYIEELAVAVEPAPANKPTKKR